MNPWNPQHERDDDDWSHPYESDEELEIEIVDIDDEDILPVQQSEEQGKQKGQEEYKETIWSVGSVGNLGETQQTEQTEFSEHSDEVRPMKKSTRVSLSPRFSIRQRRGQLVFTVGFASLLLIVLLGSYAPTRQTLVRTFSPPVTPTSMLTPGTDRFYIAGEPPWGHLYVDGKRVTHLPDPIRSEPPLQLSRGKHMLTWVAAPFPPRSCTVSVPPDFRVDSCDFNSFIQTTTLHSAWLFSFPVTLIDLPSNSQSALMQAAQQALDANAPSETVRVGEVYASNTAKNSLGVAKEPLTATLKYQLDTMDMAVSTCSQVLVIDNSDCAYEGQDCHLFCTAPQLFSAPFGEASAPSQMWDVLAVVSYRWDYKTLNGKVVAANQPDQPQGVTPQNHLIPLQISWDGSQWHAVSNFSQLDPGVFSGDVAMEMGPACASAISNVAGDKSLARVLPSYYLTSWVYNSADNFAAGCVGIVTLQGGMPQTPQQTPAYCLHRFGVFLAANKIAQEYFPKMPVADSYEQELARQIADAYVQTQ
ncbi:MAG TPA: hypothetical protein DHW02_09370 [Ktedonobacter sp.]|nr:hypothetical protein [Ktedonobacter sp.]